LLRLCCSLSADSDPPVDNLKVVLESQPVGLYRPGESTDIVVLDRTPADAVVWDRLAEARLHLSFEACYCSVLGDCWTSDLDPVSDPKPVDRCVPLNGYRE
jgi:hypothetical protein